MNANSLYLFTIQDKPYNCEHFTEFLTQLIQHFTTDGITGAHIVMDNVAFHHSREVLNLIRDNGHNSVFLPPYSPFQRIYFNMSNA